MGLSDLPPDEDPLVQCALALDVINHIVCYNFHWILQKIEHWQSYMFQFGVQMAQVFEVDVITKLNRLMPDIHRHLVHLSCISYSSSEENDMTHKEFKTLYNSTNKHLDAIDSQLLTSWIEISLHESHPSSSFPAVPPHN